MPEWTRLAQKVYDYILTTKDSHSLNIRRPHEKLYRYTSFELRRAVPELPKVLIGFIMTILEHEGKIEIVNKWNSRGKYNNKTIYIIRIKSEN